jgi:hypothetical protein
MGKDGWIFHRHLRRDCRRVLAHLEVRVNTDRTLMHSDTLNLPARDQATPLRQLASVCRGDLAGEIAKRMAEEKDTIAAEQEQMEKFDAELADRFE